VAGDTPQIRSLVDGGVDGWLVGDSASSIARAIEEGLADPDRAARMGASGRRKVESRFSWDRIVEETLSVYRGAIDRSPEAVET
jgi:starch synthase